MSNLTREALSTPVQPKTIELDGVGPIHGWESPSYSDASDWEITHNIDVLGPDFERYDGSAERIVQDWDDTMKNTGKWWIVAHREVLQDFGFDDNETSDENILKLFGNIHVGDTLGIDRFKRGDKQYTDDEVWGLIKGRAGELLAEDPMDPLLVKAMKLASRSGETRFAVWSSSPRELLDAAIEANGLEGVYDAVVSVDDVQKHKPDPEGLFAAVKAMDVARGYLEPGEDYSEEKPRTMNGVWMMGDSPNDVRGGKDAGASTLWLEHPLQAHSALTKRKERVEAALAQTSSISPPAEAYQVLHHMRPTASLRTYQPSEAGIEGAYSVEQLPFEEVANLNTYNVGLAHFLLDKNLRSKLYRTEAVYEELRMQRHRNRMDPTKISSGDFSLLNVFSEVGETLERTVAVPHQPLSEAQVDKLFDDVVWSIHENTPGY